MIRTLFSDYVRFLNRSVHDGWNHFWFTPESPETLALIRISTGLMLLYTHFVWSFELNGFLGSDGRLPLAFVDGFHQHSAFAWTWFRWLTTPWMLWGVHVLALFAFGLLTLGVKTRFTAPLAFVFAVSYAHRAVGALFGLDQINLLLALYLAVGDSGGAFSWDAWKREPSASPPAARKSTSTNVALRLIQVHMCVVYFFAAVGKLQGVSWWEGEAMWFALANYEYQTLDMTFLRHAPLVINALTHITVLWELSYCVLVWPSVTRPLVLALAIPMHMGIAICMGMVTFGLIMLVGNLAFVPADLIRRLIYPSSAARVDPC